MTTPATHRNKLAYGTNAVAMAVIAVVLVIALNVFFGRFSVRTDLSFGRVNELSPATKKLLGDLDAKKPGKVVIANLFEVKNRSQKTEENKLKDDNARSVSDLLREYSRVSGNIQVITPSSRDDIESMIKERFAAENEQFEKTFKEFDVVLKDLETFSTAEGKNFSVLAQQQNAPRAIINFAVFLRRLFVEQIPINVEDARRNIDKEARSSMPRWSDALASAQSALTEIDERLKIFTSILEDTKNAKAEDITSDAARKIINHIKEIEPDISRHRAAISDFTKRFEDLPKSKLADIFLPQEACLVVFPPEKGPDAQAIRVIERNKLFSTMPSRTGQSVETFEGEGPLSSAILPLVRTAKTRLVFVTNGSLEVFQQFTEVQRRLEQNNFTVDLWAPPDPMAMMRGQAAPTSPPRPQASGKGVVWVIVAAGPSREGMIETDPAYREIQEHLALGGGALFLANPSAQLSPKDPPPPSTNPDESDAKRKLRNPVRYLYADLISPFGIKVDPNYSVLATVEAEDARGVRKNLSLGFIIVTDFPDDPITKPIDSLRTGLGMPFANQMRGYDAPYLTTMVDAIPTPGATSSVILRVPKTVDTLIPGSGFLTGTVWANANDNVFMTDAPSADEPAPQPPFPIAARGSRMKDGEEQRVVVIGNMTFAFDGLVIPAELEQTASEAIRSALLPGNAELFSNAVMWTAHDENHIAVSAKASSARRIGDINPGTLAFLNWGLLYLGLPALALIAGALVYAVRHRA